MRKQMKKYIGMLLAICMIITLIPYGARAAGAVALSAESVFIVSAGNNHTLMILNDSTL